MSEADKTEDATPNLNAMPIIERRRIEAELLAEVYAVAKARYGEAEAEAVIDEAVTRSAIAQGKSFARDLGHAPDLSDFAAILPRWTANGSLEIDVLEAGPDKLSFNVTRCRYAEMYRDMGLGPIGHLLSCNRDGEFCTGYNPDMKLERNQTIMGGASHCDFRYRMEPAPGTDANGDKSQ